MSRIERGPVLPSVERRAEAVSVRGAVPWSGRHDAAAAETLLRALKGTRTRTMHINSGVGAMATPIEHRIDNNLKVRELHQLRT